VRAILVAPSSTRPTLVRPSGRRWPSGTIGGVVWQTCRLRAEPDAVAPDGSAIRVLATLGGASMVHCTLQPGQTTVAVRHRSVEELWYCLGGRGELWRAAGQDGAEEVVHLEPGMGASIPLGVRFQFRVTGTAPLELVIATVPPWPGPDEAVAVDGRWPPAGVGSGG